MFTYCLHPGMEGWVKEQVPTIRILVTHALKLCKRSQSSRSRRIIFFKTFRHKQANEFAAACRAFIRGYDKLARLCVQKNVSRFKLVPKMHICRQSAEDIVLLYDIKHHHCNSFEDEDCVGIMKKLACKVHAGSLMEYRIICRWLLRVKKTWDCNMI